MVVTHPKHSARSAVLALLVAMVGVAVPDPAHAVGGEGESWPSFNESAGCGSPWSIGPNVESQGPLGHDAVLRGPQAAYFGRTVAEVAESLVPWAVPMSDGEVLKVHRRTLPALQQVTANLALVARRGWTYDIAADETFGYTARTVGGRYRVSQHSFGNAVDINSRSNPSTEGPLITDMPGWFVRAWTDAGFCWGGNWVTKSDAMHFSWRGPAFNSTFASLPGVYQPLTEADDFSTVVYKSVVPGYRTEARFEILMDGDGDSVVDLVRLFNRAGSLVVEVTPARSGYAACAVERFRIPSGVAGSAAIPGDWDADGIPDLWIIDDTDGVSVTVLQRADGFLPSEPVRLAVPSGDRYLTADFDVDGWSDLYILRRATDGWSVEIRSGKDRLTSVLAETFIPADADSRFTAIDRDLNHVPDLIAIGFSSVFILDGASGFVSTAPSRVDVTAASDLAGTDFDGDGRHDLAVLHGRELTVYAGNTPLEGVEVASWFQSPIDSCDEAAEPIHGR